jgi:hypothetical protein
MNHIETIGTCFIDGYHAGLAEQSDHLDESISKTNSLYEGFVYEGAAMGYAIADALSIVKRDRWSQFLTGAGRHQPYILHVGLGWAFARIPWIRRYPEKHLKKYEPLLKWLIIDGFGFHEGFFNAPRWLGHTKPRPLFSDYGQSVFDQGLGRSLWFVLGTNIKEIGKCIGGFERSRHADLWSGVGLAAAYAGTGSESAFDVGQLFETCEGFIQCLAQGIAFGAEARELAGIPAAHTESLCQSICGLSATETAQITYEALPSNRNRANSYEAWRTNIRDIIRTKVAA